MEKKSQSHRSLQSGPSTLTSTSAFDGEDSIFKVALLDNDRVLLRKLDHDNVDKFLGLSFDGMDYAMFSRSVISTDSFFVQCIIRDVAEKRKNFINRAHLESRTVLFDIVGPDGLNYIHHSFIGYHGRLTSACCLLTDAFQVKISDYGMSELTRLSELKCQLLGEASH
ncbi:hypothetical protein ANCDUO_03764 [Ancylostoma duodenale]|uniref:Protein kinase domain-containing protein n=1 Tax=Ancylostoma duodenale TaxID=51022 RepID=A0A0C2H327_9BILA|nr:hypothetical protein ANCDUO_03764 [Ancylostoma duodenale]